MQLNDYGKRLSPRTAFSKQNLLVMKLTVLLLTVTCLQLRAKSYAQQITLKEKFCLSTFVRHATELAGRAMGW